MHLREFVEVDLQREFVEVLKRNVFKFIDQVALDQPLLHLGRLFFPLRLFQRKEAVANEPSEGHRTVVQNSVSVGLSAQFCHLPFQFLARLEFGHLRPGAKNDWNDAGFHFVVRNIHHGPAKVAVPFLAACNDPTPLL